MSYTCPYCHHHCTLQEGKTGFCRVRTLQDGKNVCGNYGFLTSLALDPIEKKPLNRFYPGTTILSLGSYGCNLRCPFCQYFSISQNGRDAFQPVIAHDTCQIFGDFHRKVPVGDHHVFLPCGEPARRCRG